MSERSSEPAGSLESAAAAAAPDDRVQPFQIEGMDVRGRAVRLGPAVEEIVTAHAYPPALSWLLGEFLALTAMLGSIVKTEGLLTVQAKATSKAPVDFVVADFAAPDALRGYAKLDEETAGTVPADAGFRELLGEGGHLALTIEQGRDKERYQGIVELSGQGLADCAVTYFEQSEQTPTTVRLACGREPQSQRWRAGGMMIQHLAGGTRDRPDTRKHLRVIDSSEEENWNRAALLMNSVKSEELLDPELDLNTLLYRLFHEEGVRVFEPVDVAHRCRCSPERLRNVLDRFSKAELADMVVGGEIVATCQFCGAAYRFDPDAVGRD